MTILLVFALSLIQNYLATRVISYIAERDPFQSCIWAGLSSAASITIAIMIVEYTQRWILLGPYVIGDMLATYLAVKRR